MTDPRIPNEKEKKKLKEIYSYYRTSELYMLFMLYPTLILIVLTCFLEQDRKLVFAIVMFSIIMLLGIIYLIIRREFVKRCPRCSTRGIPPVSGKPSRGNCPRCGMLLDLPNKKKIL